MKKVIACLCTAMLLSSGCATRGQLAILEWDSRSPEQVGATIPADTAIMLESRTDTPEPEQKSFVAWSALFTMISSLKVRLRVFHMQWNDKD